MRRLMCLTALAASCALGAAEEKPFVAFVNVKGAVEAPVFAEAVTNFLPGVMQVRARLAEAMSVDVVGAMNPSRRDTSLPKAARLAVYFVKDPAFPPQLTAPGMFAVINVRNLEKGVDRKGFATRIRKMVLKGLAFACGFGANQDVGRCVMGAGSFETLAGIDGTSASYSPFVAFPMSDYLMERGLVPEEPAF